MTLSLPVDKGLVTTAVLHFLEQRLAPVPIGDAKRPSGIGERATYGVLTRITSPKALPDLVSSQGTGEVKFQLTCVSEVREVADTLLARADRVLFARENGKFLFPIEIAGHEVIAREQSIGLTGADNLSNNLMQFDLMVSREAG